MCEAPDAPRELPDPHGRLDSGPGVTRRGLLRRGGLLTAAALLPGAAGSVWPAAAYAGTTAPGTIVVPMAMHVHGSFSEGSAGVSASWQTQLTEADLAGVRVLWPTDHDWRMSAYKAPGTFHTDALAERVLNYDYRWRPAPNGALASSDASAVATPSSPADSSARKGSLHLAAVSSGAAEASSRLYLDGSVANDAHRTNVTNQVIRLQVLPDAVGGNAYGELLLNLSHHPATAGRPGGIYQLSYRFGPGTASSYTQGLLAVVRVPVLPGSWNEVALDLVKDVAAAWPDLVAEDNALTDLWLGATSSSSEPASVYFGYLRIEHQTQGDLPLQVQAKIFKDHGPAFPRILVKHGQEVSLSSAHVNGFGGQQHLVDYNTPAAQQARRSTAAYTTWSANLIHGYGGLASLNHPFGSENSQAPPARQDDERRALAARLIPPRAYGVDILEVGYRVRGGAGLETHLGLWDALSRAGVWLTGNGVNDAHGGHENDWRKLTNRFVTSVLAASTQEKDLLTALSAGSAFVQELGGFTGVLDIHVEGAPMGSVSVAPGKATRQLTITATALAQRSEVRVVQAPVDYGTAVDSGAQVVSRVPASALLSGSASVQLQTYTSSFVRVEVWTAQSRLVAFTNPIWLLKEMPPVLPGPDRRSPDTSFGTAS